MTRIAHDAYQHYTERIGKPAAPMTADYAATIKAGNCWVAATDDEVLGFAVLIDQPDHLLLDNIAVSPAAQGHGVGAALLHLAETEAQRRALTEIRLYTNEAMTENITYYPRHGYSETHRGEQDGYRRVYFTKHLASGTEASASTEARSGHRSN
ncbi:GNAT family N-acetyltransferase [Pseudonocardia sp.]|uniref:GNAT family N-acetyltransferase n=1 Tax=Pseudonocardia sp. TaxID=60912 RepID=UPI0031FD8CD6